MAPMFGHSVVSFIVHCVPCACLNKKMIVQFGAQQPQRRRSNSPIDADDICRIRLNTPRHAKPNNPSLVRLHSYLRYSRDFARATVVAAATMTMAIAMMSMMSRSMRRRSSSSVRLAHHDCFVSTLTVKLNINVRFLMSIT